MTQTTCNSIRSQASNQVGDAQQGKSRLTAYTAAIIGKADEVIAAHVHELLQSVQLPPGMSRPSALPVTTIGMMDFTVTEFFVRTNGDWPQVEPPDGPLPGIPKRIVDSNLVSPDELYGFNACFGLGGDEDSKGKAGPNKHASTLNTLLNTGKTQRDTRHSGHHGSSATKPVNVAVVGNTHWKTFIGMERGLVGNHVQCTKERFVVTAGEACRRHDALPLDFVLPPDVPSRWTWLPLNGRLAKAFGCGDLYQQPAQRRTRVLVVRWRAKLLLHSLLGALSTD